MDLVDDDIDVVLHYVLLLRFEVFLQMLRLHFHSQLEIQIPPEVLALSRPRPFDAPVWISASSSNQMKLMVHPLLQHHRYPIVEHLIAQLSAQVIQVIEWLA